MTSATPGQSTMRRVTAEVAQRYGLELADLLMDTQSHYIAHPRQEAMAEIYALGRFSYPQIGRFFGRDHTTVMHALRSLKRRRAVHKQSETRGQVASCPDDAGTDTANQRILAS